MSGVHLRHKGINLAGGTLYEHKPGDTKCATSSPDGRHPRPQGRRTSTARGMGENSHNAIRNTKHRFGEQHHGDD